MKVILNLILIIIVCSCSFKSNDNDKKNAKVELITSDFGGDDFDGDRINNNDEVLLGLDPYVADIPKVKANFLQNYRVKAIFEDESEFLIDTKVARDNPDFKYRVGELFIKRDSLKSAARIGRFSGVSWGEIKQRDISWIQFPDISPEYYFSKVREYTSNHKKTKSVSITIENNLKLLDSQLYDEIRDLQINYYYYSYSKEDYVLLKTQVVDQVFQSGVNEKLPTRFRKCTTRTSTRYIFEAR